MNQNLPTIDREICTGCGACLSICPDRILAADTSGKALVNGDSCMQCGHCYAVCPVEAVSVPFLDQPEDLRSVKIESKRPAGGAAQSVWLARADEAAQILPPLPGRNG